MAGPTPQRRNHEAAKEFDMIHLEHSPLGGSGAHRFMTCAGSFLLHRHQLENDEFENIESEFASRGTAAHELAARAIIENTEPFEYLGEDFGGYLVGWPGGISLDATHVYFNECLGIVDRQGFGRVLVEETIHLPDLHPLLRGTVDFGYYNAIALWLRDYKNGEGIGVAAGGNRQLLYYAFLMIMADEHLRNLPRDFPCDLGIVQPNFYGIFEEPDTWVTTIGYVLDWGHNELLPRMNALMRAQDIDESDFVPGSHCQFCPVLLDCPKMQQAFREYVEGSEDFVLMLTDEELDRYYSQREYARRFMNALEATVHARLIGGAKIPSAKLVEKKTNRVWKPGAQAALTAAFGDKAFTPREIKSPAQIEKLSSRGKELALEFGYKPESVGLSVAPISDPRPAAKPKTNAAVFEAHAQRPEELGF
ncbi:MAG: hypothetical protein C0510_06825 [Erythrobacter sp.]|nr:hypothetical protein [Erythrobacter sp.]